MDDKKLKEIFEKAQKDTIESKKISKALIDALMSSESAKKSEIHVLNVGIADFASDIILRLADTLMTDGVTNNPAVAINAAICEFNENIHQLTKQKFAMKMAKDQQEADNSTSH